VERPHYTNRLVFVCLVSIHPARCWQLPVHRLRRPAFLLSGLLTCGCCGGKYGIVVNDRYGCLGHFRKGICDNGRTIRRGDIERRVLAGLTDKLVSPEAVAVAVRAYAQETNRQNHERRAQAEASRRALEKIDRSIKGILGAIEDGMYQPAMKARMGELAQRKADTLRLAILQEEVSLGKAF
jgi:site-specific DNA recombinase